jgi:hypothetical protein
MTKRNPLESSLQAILDIRLVPAVAHLPAALAAERRDVAAREALLCRIHSEFEEMPGLLLTPAQAAKLFGLPRDIASRILDRLAAGGVLRQSSQGQFALRIEGT